MWANQLKIRAKKGPSNVSGKRTKHWPHSDSPSVYRPKDVGENIAWDLTENGHPCRESVYRWYAELFYFNPKKPTKGNTLLLIQQPIGTFDLTANQKSSFDY